MELQTRILDNRTVVTIPVKQIKLENISWLSQSLFEIIDTIDHSPVLDLSDVDSIDSQALGFLISIHKRCIINGGRLSLLGVNSSILYLLKVTRIDNILDIFENETHLEVSYKTSA
jgi:anti-sigma B factor antagonist